MELKRKILDKTYTNRYTIHPGENKMYQDLNKLFWCAGIKCDMAKIYLYV
jgi:hypothetical protein